MANMPNNQILCYKKTYKNSVGDYLFKIYYIIFLIDY